MPTTEIPRDFSASLCISEHFFQKVIFCLDSDNNEMHLTLSTLSTMGVANCGKIRTAWHNQGAARFGFVADA
jgi:hypothetical protein